MFNYIFILYLHDIFSLLLHTEHAKNTILRQVFLLAQHDRNIYIPTIVWQLMITTLWKYPEKKNYKVYAILSPLFANCNSLAKHLNMLCMSIQKIVHCIVGTLYKLTARINREIAFAASSPLHSYYLLPTDHFDCSMRHFPFCIAELMPPISQDEQQIFH